MNRISNTGDKGRRGFKEAEQALGWLKNKYKGWDGRKKGDWSQTLASVFNAQILVCVYLTVFLKFLIYHRIFPSKRKITCITDFEIDFTNCTRKPFLNLVSFIKKYQFYWKRPDRQVTELAGCPQNGHTEAMVAKTFHALASVL